jgi:hypothetical protein
MATSSSPPFHPSTYEVTTPPRIFSAGLRPSPLILDTRIGPRNLPKEAEKFFAIFSGLQNQEGFPSESAKGVPIG